MSGGHFNYDQFKIACIANEIEHEIEKNGRPKTKEELKDEHWRGEDWYEKYPEDLNHRKYPDEVIEKFKEAVRILKMAEIYTRRIDWLLSGDDGEESFLERLQEDLKKLEDDNASH